MEFWTFSVTAIVTLHFAFRVMADDHEFRLIRNLLHNYDKRVRPIANVTEPLNITFGLALAQIIDVDERNQILTSNCWLNQVWLDANLQWDPDKYGGIKVIRLPYSDVWRPDILLYNNADVSSYFSSISSNVIVTHEGNVTWLSMVIFKSSCRIDVRYFPFDEQNCSMMFASWTYDGFQLNLVINTPDGDVSNYIRNSEWILAKLQVKWKLAYYSCCPEPYPDITYYIKIRRRPLFYVFNMILPCILITLVALLGFYIPSDSGEKVSMGITTLLSMTVFMMLVAENMPPTSDVLPLIGIYYGITICIVSFATGMTVFTLNIHHKGTRGHEVPTYVKKICFGFLAKVFCMRLENYALKTSNVEMNPLLHQQTPCNRETGFQTETHDSNGGISPRFSRLLGAQSRAPQLPPCASAAADDFERQFKRVLAKVSQTIERNEIRLAEQDKRDMIKLEWQQVALIVDRFLLSCFVLITLVVTCAVILEAPHSTENIVS